MKRILLSCFLCTLLAGDEIQRIESIVNDITKLRSAYETCQEELLAKPVQTIAVTPQIDTVQCDKQEDMIHALTYQLKDEKEKNTILQEDIEKMVITHNNELKTKEKLYKNLEKKQNEIILEKDETIKSLQNQTNSSGLSIKENKKPVVIVEKYKEEPNPFPKLLLKEKYREKVKIEEETLAPMDVTAFEVAQIEGEILKSVEQPRKEIIEKIIEKPRETPKEKIINKQKPKKKIVLEKIDPSTFRLIKESSVFNGIDGKIVEAWEEGTSFTSNQRYKKWIKITGYFKDKKWLRSKKELWILEENVVKR
ncbi:MAG: hypothetical protein RBR59_04630 [Sulfurimonadaceae bacterium]|jgi:hypothetical protein|nr:hypothetical protein [Sulfurimonadaceae bacterium]